jgi:hypothetical protein
MNDIDTGHMPPEIEKEDEHIIRRLGWAVIRQWNNLPPAVQERIREQSFHTADRSGEAVVQLRQKIEIFTEKYTS